MARSGGGGYNLTVQLNLQGPSNVNQVVNNINRQLGNIQANVNVNLPRNAANQLANINRSMQQTTRAAVQCTSAMESFGRAAGLAVRRFGAFTAATAGFYAITRATQQSLEKFVEFDRQITRIAQVTNTTKQSLNGLSSEITRLATSLGASSSELAAVSVTLSQAGLSARETEKALKALALTTLAPTFNNLNQTVEGSIALMKQFSISTSQLEKALGSINAVAGSFAVEAGDLITAVQRAGGVFAAASQGVSTGTDALNEFLAVFTSVRATTRESAETIATGLRTIFTRLQREDTIAALQAFGVQLTDLEGKFIGPYKAVEQLAKGLGKLDPRSLEFSGIIEELGGFRQVGKVIPLIQRFATAQQALNVAQQGSGSLAKDAAIGQQSLAVQISKVKEEFDALIRSIGETAEFKQFIRLSLDLASALIQVADAIKPVLPAIAALGAVRIAGGIGNLARGFRGGLGFNSGGLVPGSGNSDSVRASLTPGEYVIRKKAVQAIGVSNLERMNKYADGGYVKPDALPSSQIRSRITRTGTQDQYLSGKRINSGDKISLNVRSMRFDGGNVGDKQFEQRVAASVKGRWVGSDNNYPVDVIGPQGPIEVRNRKTQTPKGILADKLARHKLMSVGEGALSNKMQNDTINLGTIYVAYNTGKQPAEQSKKVRSLSRLPAGAKKSGYDFRTQRAATGGPISGQDTVPALLTPGEYVINARAASAIGEQRLNALNNADRIGYNTGGPVGPRLRFNDGGGRGWGGLGAYGMPARGTNPNSRRNNTGGMPGGSFTFLFGLQAAASGLQAAFDQTTESGAQSAGAIQGFTTGLTSAIVAFELFKTAGSAIPGVTSLLTKIPGPLGNAIGIATAGLIAVGSAVVGYLNAQKELEKKLSQEKFTSSLDAASTALEDAAKGTQGAIQTFNANMISAAQAAEQLRESQNQYRYSLIGSTIDFFAGADDQTDITRSRILQEQGTLAYLGSFFGDVDSKLRKNQETFSERDRAAAAKEAENIAKMQIQRGSQIIDKGGSLRDVANDAIGPEVREAMARSNVEVAKVLDQTADPKQRERIINQEVGRQLTQSLGPLIQEREARAAENAANQAAQQLQVALNRVFDAMKQNFAAVGANIEARFDQVADSLAVSLGQGKFQYSSNQLKTILNNTKAFSDDQVRGAIASTMPLLGDKGGRIGDLALASTRMEGQIGNIIDNVLLNANVAEGAKLSTIGTEFIKLISGLNLGSDVEKVINDQLKKAFEKAQKDLGDNARPEEIRQRVQEIVENIPSLNGALDVVKEAMETFSAAQNRYSQAVQQVTEAVLKQQEYLNRAASIRREGALDLRKARGENIGLQDIISNVFKEVRNTTGGSTNVEELFKQQRTLMGERERVVGRLSDISGMADANEEFITLRNRLADLDIQLTRNRNGLEFLANNTEIAGAALKEFSDIQSKARDQLSYAEKLVSASPEELYGMRLDFRALQNIMDGGNLNLMNSYQAQTAMMRAYGEGANPYEVQMAGQQALASQRGSMISMMKELQPFFGDNRQFQEAYGNVMRSFLQSTGMYNQNWEEAIQRSLGRGDAQQRALRVYQRAIDIQSQANQALADLPEPMVALTQATWALRNSIMELRQRSSGIGGMAANPPGMAANPPQRRASGGVIYASNGQLVNMEPRGTDTVPAMLTPGEFVVNARSTKKHRRLLERINGGGVPSVQDGVSYANDGGIMERAALFYGARLRWYRENFGMGAQRVIPLAAHNMIRQQSMSAAIMEQQQQQQQERYNQWLNSAAGQNFVARRNNLEWDIMNRYPIGSILYSREKARIQNLTPAQVLIEERRIEQQREKKQRLEKAKAANFKKQEEKRAAEKAAREAEIQRQREAAAEAGADPAAASRTPSRRDQVGSIPSEQPRTSERPPRRSSQQDNFNPFGDGRDAVIYRRNRDGTVTIIRPYSGESETIGTPIVNTFAGPNRQAGQTAQAAQTQQAGQSAQTQQINTTALQQRAEMLMGRNQANLEETQKSYDSGYRGISGWFTGLVQRIQGGYAQAVFEDQMDSIRRKIARIKEAQSLIAMSNDANLSYEKRYEAYQQAHRILHGAHLSSSTFARDDKPIHETWSDSSAKGAAIAYKSGADLASAGAGPIIRGGGAALGAVRRGAGALATRGSEAIVRRGSGALGNKGAEAVVKEGAARTGTTVATEASEAAARKAARLAAEEAAARKAAQKAAEEEAKAAGTTLSRLGRGGTHTAGRSTVSFGSSNPPYAYQAGNMPLEEAAKLESQVAPFAERYMQRLNQLGNPYRGGVTPPSASDQGLNYFRFSPYDRYHFYNRGGIVQPAYLFGGGTTVGVSKLPLEKNGPLTAQLIMTDPLAWQAYNPLTKYSSAREKSADRIKYGYSGLGMGSFAASKGLGLDPLGRPLFESGFGYSDPRSDERDFQTIFGYNRYPSFLASGGLARGTDKYPAMLSRGEMVMNAEATRKNEGILRAMNKSSGGIVNNGILYAANGTGGPIGMSGSGGGFGGGGVLGGAFELSQSMNTFVSVSDFVIGSFDILSNSLSLFTQMDFGVLNEGATMMQTASSIFRTAASSLGTPLSSFGQSVQNFVSQTSNLISAISKIGDINGTINVTGRIDIPPIQVNVVGAEIIQRIVPDIESKVMNSIATSLANDNPGMNVSSLSVSSPY